MTQRADRNILVLGIGNILMSDDGVGVRAVHLLSERYQLPEGVTVMDGGVLGLDLLPEVQAAQRLLVVDAVETGAPPGTLASSFRSTRAPSSRPTRWG